MTMGYKVFSSLLLFISYASFWPETFSVLGDLLFSNHKSSLLFTDLVIMPYLVMNVLRTFFGCVFGGEVVFIFASVTGHFNSLLLADFYLQFFSRN